MLISLVLVAIFGVGFIAIPAWVLWTLWREWPQRRFKFAGQLVSRERYPVSYWIGLALGSVCVLPVAYQGARVVAFALTHWNSN